MWRCANRNWTESVEGGEEQGSGENEGGTPTVPWWMTEASCVKKKWQWSCQLNMIVIQEFEWSVLFLYLYLYLSLMFISSLNLNLLKKQNPQWINHSISHSALTSLTIKYIILLLHVADRSDWWGDPPFPFHYKTERQRRAGCTGGFSVVWICNSEAHLASLWNRSYHDPASTLLLFAAVC